MFHVLKIYPWVGDVTQLVEYVSSMHEATGSVPSTSCHCKTCTQSGGNEGD